MGNHTIYFEYPGQMFAYYHFSPVNLSYIRLYEADANTDLGYIESASLSRRYDYTLFDASLNDMQFNFAVYPNGTIGVDGKINYTRMYPENMGPQINASTGISTNGNITTGSLDGRLVFTEESMPGSPFNFIAANFSSKYDSGLVNSTLKLILFVPPEATNAYPFNATDFDFTSSYRNGILNAELWGETQIPSDVKNTFPFNATDLTILADYLNGEIIGNITFHLIPGAPMLDVRVYFSDNKTDIYLTGNVNVTYGNYFGIEIDPTTLEDFLAELNSTIPGATVLIANMTGGLLECTSLSTAKTEWTNGLGADVQYNAAIHGNFTLFFARLLAQMFSGGSYEESIYVALESAFSSIENASLRMYYFHDSGIASIDKLKLACNVKKLWSTALELVLPTVPSDYEARVEVGLKMANATAYAIQDFNLNASYSKETQKLFFDAYLLSNATQLEEETRQLLPEMLPPPMQEIFASYMNVTYCKLTRYEATVKYENGTADFEVDWTFEGDFKAQLNHMKRFYIDFVNATSPWMLNWQLLMLNETEIDIKNFNAEFMLGKDQLYITFNGAYAKPPIDEIDFIRFKLYRWFNMTADPEEPPREFERLKITITGASNGTHTILLSAPDMVPTPDSTSLDYKSMMWENVKLSSLKDLIFRIAYQAVVDHLGERYYIPIFTNSTVSNFNFNSNARQISFNVTGEVGTGFCEITIPRALLYASVSDWIVKIDGQPLTSGEYNVTENAEYVFISLNYSHSSHLIEIVGTWVITEFQPPILPIVLVTLSLIAAVIVFKQRKRITIAKTRWQNAIQTFVNRIRPLKA